MRSIRFSALVCAFATITLATASVASYAEAPSAAVRVDRAATAVDPAQLFDAVVDTINRKFVDVERLRTLDWERRAREVRPSVVSARSSTEALAIIRALLAELKLSHTELMSPDEARYYGTLDMFSDYPEIEAFNRQHFWGSNPHYPGIGIFTAQVEGRHFVDGVLEGSPADKAGLRFGDEVVSVDTKPYTPVDAFKGKIGADAEIAVRRTRGGGIIRYRVPVIPITPSAAFADATKSSARIIERDGRRIGYIHVWSLKEPLSFRTALASLDPQLASRTPTAQNGPDERTLDALVIDMRGRVGGLTGTARELLATIGGVRQIGLSGTSRPDAPPAEVKISRRVEMQLRPFQARTALLVDHHTRSAGEVLAGVYQGSSLGQLFGTRTAGAVAGGNAFIMPGGYLLLLPAILLKLDGKPLEGTGVTPDVHVERPLPYADGADPVLDAAVKQLAAGSGLPRPANDTAPKQ